MTEILRRIPLQQLTSSSSSITCIITTPTYNQGLPQNHRPLLNSTDPPALYRRNCRNTQIQETEEHQLSVLAVLVTILRKSLVGCSNTSGVIEEELNMEIGSPTNVRHVAHVTFDRFNGFLGLPVEFEPDVPRRPPSASTRVFGVSTDSMQLSFDTRGNCVPTILLMMQRRLYSQGGLQSEGIFRINPANGQEEYVREQLNNGLIPDNIDVHCLAGLIKAWFRELPRGILDCLSPEQVMQVQSEDDCTHLVRLLPQTEAALLDWAINLMADVAQLEHLNKMNARNIAMVFAPNMTQMSDPLTALMYAVQVMNFLKTLIVKILRMREDSVVEAGPSTQIEPSDDDSHYSISKPINLEQYKERDEEEDSLAKELESNEAESKSGNETQGSVSSINSILPDDQKGSMAGTLKPRGTLNDGPDAGNGRTQSRNRRMKTGQRSNSNNAKKGSRKHIPRQVVHVNEKNKQLNLSSCVNSHTQRGEAWR